MRVSSAEWGVIKICALERGARVSEIMRDALKMYMQQAVNHTYRKEC